jgi:hypothetical protein
MTTTTPSHLARSAADRTPAEARTTTPADAVTLRRRTIDRILIGFGVVATLAFVIAGGLLTWGSQFSADYVHDELAAQKRHLPHRRRAPGRGS